MKTVVIIVDGTVIVIKKSFFAQKRWPRARWKANAKNTFL